MANELSREAKYEDFEEEQTINGETEFVKREGAISLLRKTFRAWAVALEPFPFLKNEDTSFKDDLFDDLRRYNELLRITGNEWPKDLELQPMIDERERLNADTKLPTSDQLEAKSLQLDGVSISDEDDQEQPESEAQSETPEKSEGQSESDQNEGDSGDGNQTDNQAVR